MMFSWCFSGLFTSLRDFLADDSGYVQPREGLGLGWVAGALAALAVMIPQGSEATLCNPHKWVADYDDRCYPHESNCISQLWCLGESGWYPVNYFECRLCP